MQLNEMVDEYNRIRKEREELSRKLEKMEGAENELELLILKTLHEQGLSAAGGKTCLVRANKTDVPYVKDWNKLWEHIRSTGEFELLHKRVTMASVADRWNEGIEVPGVERYPVESLHVTQIKG